MVVGMQPMVGSLKLFLRAALLSMRSIWSLVFVWLVDFLLGGYRRHVFCTRQGGRNRLR
jgi:hypothetical protein